MPSDRECEKRFFRMDRRQIHFLKFILEGYDGVAVLRTIDPDLGLVVLSVAPGCGLEVDQIIRDLGKDICIEAVSPVQGALKGG